METQDFNLEKLEKKIGTKIKNQSLLITAVTHRSYLNEHPEFKLDHNERLEFLGDAVLEIIVTEHLFHSFPKTPEGDLTNWRASLVNSEMLHRVAVEIELEDHLLLSKGEAKDKDSKARYCIVANAVEAVIGAIYLDQGKKFAKNFIHKYIIAKLDNILKNKLYLDPKSKFQENAQEKYGITPEYKVLDSSGPDHDKTFQMGLYLGNELIAKGIGSSKQEAQMKAAHKGNEIKKW